MRGKWSPISRAGFAAIFCIALCQIGSAKVLPSFSLDFESWHATDIVLVRAADEGGVFTVIEPLKGILQPGDKVQIPELKPEPEVPPIWSYPLYRDFRNDDLGTEIPKQVAGERLVLFLTRKSAQNGNLNAQWAPADHWVEDVGSAH